jgi:hypothetical protein
VPARAVWNVEPREEKWAVQRERSKRADNCTRVRNRGSSVR